MDLAGLHVAAAGAALVLGAVVLLRAKGSASHVALGRVYVGVILLVNVPALLVVEATGRPGPFHALAVVSLTTTALGWWAVRRHGRDRRRLEVHAALMTWSFLGVATAGLAQLAHARWPDASPLPVLAVVAVATGAGLVLVPRYASAQLRRRAAQ